MSAARAGGTSPACRSTTPNTALIVVDVLNPYEHEDADELVESMSEVVPNIAELVRRARDEQQPVIYVNDNYGNWNSSSEKLLRAALGGRHPELVEPLRPPEDASFVIKARHSIFYETPLEYLLRQLGVERVMLCGQVTEQCILYSALDAYVRHFERRRAARRRRSHPSPSSPRRRSR